MQDNNTPDINPEWIEEGWSGMRQLLDQELPAQDHRPMAWAWWGGAALLLGLGFFISQAASPSSKTIGHFPVPSTVVPTTAYTEGKTAERPTSPIGEIVPQSNHEKVAATPSKSTPSVHLAASAVPGISANSSIRNSDAGLQYAPSTPTTAVTKNPEPSPKVIATINRIIPAAAVVSLLPTLPLQWVNNGPRLAPFFNQEPELVRSPNSYSIGVLAGSALSPVKEVRSYEAGVFLGWQAPGSNWYGRLSLTYQQFSTNQLIEERQFAFTSSRGVAPGNNTALITVSSNAERLRFANASLQVGYQLTPRIGLETGFFIAYLAQARQRNTWQATIEPTGGNGTDGSQEALSALNNTTRYTSTTGLERWNPGWTTGVSYQINRNLFTTIQYRAQFNSLLRQPGQEANNKMLSLSLFRHF